MKNIPMVVMNDTSGHQKSYDLSDPQRKTSNTDTARLKQSIEQTSRISHVSHFVKMHIQEENLLLGEQIQYPKSARLRPIQNSQKINQNKAYFTINTQRRGCNPISEEKMDEIIENWKSVVVYSIKEEDSIELVENNNILQNNIQQCDSEWQHINNDPYICSGFYQRRHLKNPINQPQTNKIINEQVHQFNNKQKQHSSLMIEPITVMSKKNRIISSSKPKYNLFSAIDQLVNYLLFNLSCRCPDNQIIAPPIYQISWYEMVAKE